MTLNDIDYDIRRFNSFILRIVLIIILVSIIIFNQNFFSDWIYYASLIIYIALLFLNLFFVKIERKGVVRLVLDLAIINIFLYNKDLNYILNYLPFFLLIYNVQSHSNKNDKLIYFVLGVHLSLLNIDKFSLILTHHLIPIIFYFFIFILSIRKSFLFVNQEIIVLIGDLFIENVNENNSHKILKDVITKINDSKVKIINQVDEIFLFINNSEKLVLIKASKFVINNDITSSLGFEQLIVGSKIKKNPLKDSVTIDNIKYQNCYWLNHKVQNKDYYFMISLKKENVFNESLISNLRPIFEYIARIFFMSNSLIEVNNHNQKIIKQKVAYVFDAQNALHFVKNKLSPVTATIGLIDRYFKQEINSEQKKYIEGRLKNNNNSNEIKGIIKKAEILIKGVDNIIDENDEIISLKTLVDDIRKHWYFHFNNIDDVIINIDDLSDFDIEINQMMFDFVFTDIIENINKYGTHVRKVEISIQEDFVTIKFVNEIKDFERNKLDLDEIVSLYNLKDNDEIYSRKTHGLSFIRRLLRKKNINNRIFIDQENKTFNNEIKIKKLRNENISV